MVSDDHRLFNDLISLLFQQPLLRHFQYALQTKFIWSVILIQRSAKWSALADCGAGFEQGA